MVNIFSPLGQIEKRKLWTSRRREYEVGIFITCFDQESVTRMFVEINLFNVFSTIAENNEISLVDIPRGLASILARDNEVLLIENTHCIVKFALDLSGAREHYYEKNRKESDTEKKFTIANQNLLIVAHKFLTTIEMIVAQLEKLAKKQKNNVE